MSDKDQPVDHGLYPSPNNFEPYTQADIDAARETHIEWFGILQVHQPIRPTVHEAAKETAVSCA